MGVFSRFLDIVNANINSLLDKAEDPEKMIKLMMQEMEDTLIELKSSCAVTIAAQKRIERNIGEVEPAVTRWEDRARLALDKNREDLAREALLMKKQTMAQLEQLKAEHAEKQEMIDACKDNISKVEEKLSSVRAKFQQYGAKAGSAGPSKSSKFKEDDYDFRFSQMEEHLDKMSPNAHNSSLDKEFADLEQMDEIDAELEALRSKKGKGKS